MEIYNYTGINQTLAIVALIITSIALVSVFFAFATRDGTKYSKVINIIATSLTITSAVMLIVCIGTNGDRAKTKEAHINSLKEKIISSDNFIGIDTVAVGLPSLPSDSTNFILKVSDKVTTQCIIGYPETEKPTDYDILCTSKFVELKETRKALEDPTVK